MTRPNYLEFRKAMMKVIYEKRDTLTDEQVLELTNFAWRVYYEAGELNIKAPPSINIPYLGRSTEE